jgi:hypothetical protein
MDQAVSRQSVGAKIRESARISTCGICDGQSGTETGFSPSYSVLPHQYHYTVAVHTHIPSGEMNNRSVGGRFRDSASPHQHEL